MADTRLYPRLAAARIRSAFTDTPVVMLVGPRQSGKTTLARDLLGDARAYFTLDDETTLAAARSDPTGFVRGLDRAIIDEVQHAPDLLRAIKLAVDEDRRPGRFLLTGSANLLTLPRVSESLAGRMELVTLLPLARVEILRRQSTFLSAAFIGKLAPSRDLIVGKDLERLVLAGGYPDMLRRAQPARRQAWARDYVRAIVERDVRDIAEVERLDRMPRLLRALAMQSGQLTNLSQLGGQIGLDDKTARRYVGILEQVYLVRRLEPWFRNQLKRLVKTPKLHFLDSGLLAALLGLTLERLAADRNPFGALLETFAFAELAKQVTWSEGHHVLNHYRDKDGEEVDVVIERDDGSVIGVEVKASATVEAKDFSGLRRLAAACGSAFRFGIVLFDGTQAVPFGERLTTAPISCLWS
ncbi:MAG TPA: ATP-binding protein [Vicinamibacterales bacterium]|jgi:predicted AAA+ superfamily ATPase|nr:ATP-binding protein [Vicinamibacterales bacterium]